MMSYNRKYIFSKRRARRCIARTLILSLLAMSAILVCARFFLLDGFDAQARSTETPPETDNRVAITFDDSPSRYTDKIVEILDDMDVKAAFFITGVNVPGREQSVVNIYKSGHDIGNHAWDYIGIGVKSARGAIEDIVKTEDYIKEICGRATPFVRPPYNSISAEAYKALYGAKYRIVYYDIDSGDFFNRSKQSVLEKISRAKGGDIIRFHDGRITPGTLREVIMDLREMGLEPVALSALLCE